MIDLVVVVGVVSTPTNLDGGGLVGVTGCTGDFAFVLTKVGGVVLSSVLIGVGVVALPLALLEESGVALPFVLPEEGGVAPPFPGHVLMRSKRPSSSINFVPSCLA